MIRITSGIYKGRKIIVPSGKNIKAISDRVREAIFSILSYYLNWNEIVAVDLYAGSGSIGFEALSRGSKKVIFVELSSKKIEIIKKNIQLISPEEKKVELIQSKALKWVINYQSLDLDCVVFIDPPFSSNEYDIILEKLSKLPTIKNGSFLVIQSSYKRKILFPKNLQILKHRRYGSVMIYILQKC